eukprot:CAMPEP_0117666994 /NCGR_PEP_ID=MMETSP0804-20121206/10699_1 /TAXON_ID=1074897 /ORGANISM="Tetraselmis astigmatica, Strain CCMP880" /LENGTH=585 /DNA_ID=CAMNT_0005474629 /DNA_START=272 /DNA_END=2029 /DNA_ORIENTATION=-
MEADAPSTAVRLSLLTSYAASGSDDEEAHGHGLSDVECAPSPCSQPELSPRRDDSSGQRALVLVATLALLLTAGGLCAHALVGSSPMKGPGDTAGVQTRPIHLLGSVSGKNSIEGASPLGRSWVRFRPPGATVGPESKTCREVSGHKFYLYEFESVRKLCKSGGELRLNILDGVAGENFERRQMMGPELFLHQQLTNHPWRTHDPDEASLFVVPSVLALGTTGKLCSVRMEDLVQELERELLASPYYQRSQGRDHLLAEQDFRAVRLVIYGDEPMENWRFKKLLYNFTDAAPAVFSSFRNTVRNFVFAGKHEKTYMSHGALISPSPKEMKHVPMPHLAPSSIDSCRYDGNSARIVCSEAYTGEATFEAYRQSRQYSLFFIGNGDRDEVPGSRPRANREALRKAGKLIRPRVIEELGDVYGPNILADSKPPKQVGRPNCNFTTGLTTNCRAKGLDAEFVSEKLRQSFFAVHVQGDDASSSRVFEAIAAGTPQLFLAGRYYADVAPFKCAIAYDKIFYGIDEKSFLNDPPGTVRAALDRLVGTPDQTEWEQLWNAQRKFADDLLWHTPGSRVGHNMIEDALRAVYSI